MAKTKPGLIRSSWFSPVSIAEALSKSPAVKTDFIAQGYKPTGSNPAGILATLENYPLAYYDVPTANKQIFQRNLWERLRSSTDMEDRMVKTRSFWGMPYHDDNTEVLLPQVSHKVLDFNVDGSSPLKLVNGKVAVTDTPNGLIIHSLMQDGYVGISSRGYGSLDDAPDGVNQIVSADDYFHVCWDFVGVPAVPHALATLMNSVQRLNMADPIRAHLTKYNTPGFEPILQALNESAPKHFVMSAGWENLSFEANASQEFKDEHEGAFRAEKLKPVMEALQGVSKVFNAFGNFMQEQVSKLKGVDETEKRSILRIKALLGKLQTANKSLISFGQMMKSNDYQQFDEVVTRFLQSINDMASTGAGKGRAGDFLVKLYIKFLNKKFSVLDLVKKNTKTAGSIDGLSLGGDKPKDGNEVFQDIFNYVQSVAELIQSGDLLGPLDNVEGSWALDEREGAKGLFDKVKDTVRVLKKDTFASVMTFNPGHLISSSEEVQEMDAIFPTEDGDPAPIDEDQTLTEQYGEHIGLNDDWSTKVWRVAQQGAWELLIGQNERGSYSTFWYSPTLFGETGDVAKASKDIEVFDSAKLATEYAETIKAKPPVTDVAQSVKITQAGDPNPDNRTRNNIITLVSDLRDVPEFKQFGDALSKIADSVYQYEKTTRTEDQLDFSVRRALTRFSDFADQNPEAWGRIDTKYNLGGNPNHLLNTASAMVIEKLELEGKRPTRQSKENSMSKSLPIKSSANIDAIMAYEDGSLGVPETLELFAELVKTGLAWKLQGSYGRTAQSLIDGGYISKEGEILQTVDQSKATVVKGLITQAKKPITSSEAEGEDGEDLGDPETETNEGEGTPEERAKFGEMVLLELENTIEAGATDEGTDEEDLGVPEDFDELTASRKYIRENVDADFPEADEPVEGEEADADDFGDEAGEVMTDGIAVDIESNTLTVPSTDADCNEATLEFTMEDGYLQPADGTDAEPIDLFGETGGDVQSAVDMILELQGGDADVVIDMSDDYAEEDGEEDEFEF